METWKSIEGFSKYEASTLGRVRRAKDGRIIKAYPNHGGYLRTQLINDDGFKKNVRVSRVVALTFIPNDDPQKTQVDHIVNDLTNNSVANLQWLTPQANLAKRNLCH